MGTWDVIISHAEFAALASSYSYTPVSFLIRLTADKYTHMLHILHKDPTPDSALLAVFKGQREQPESRVTFT